MTLPNTITGVFNTLLDTADTVITHKENPVTNSYIFVYRHGLRIKYKANDKLLMRCNPGSAVDITTDIANQYFEPVKLHDLMNVLEYIKESAVKIRPNHMHSKDAQVLNQLIKDMYK